MSQLKSRIRSIPLLERRWHVPHADIDWRIVLAVSCGIVSLYVALASAGAYILYKEQRSSGFTRAMERVVPYPAALVGRETISLQRLRFEVAARETYNRTHQITESSAETTNSVLERMVNRALYQQELNRRNLPVTEAAIDDYLDKIYADASGKEKLAQFLKDNYGSNVTLLDFRRWVSESLAETGIQNQVLIRVNVKHILVSVPENATGEQVEAAKKRAEDIRQKIATPDDFAKIAKDYSEDVASRDNGGTLGQTSRGNGSPVYSQEFEDAIFSLDLNQISQPVRSSYGWHILMIDQRTGTENLSLSQFTAQLRAAEKVRTLIHP